MATKKKVEKFHAVGRRKRSTARVYLMPGKGDIVINNKQLDDYFGRETSRMVVKQPLEVIDGLGKFDIHVNVKGGGASGQAGAIRHGISRALVLYQEDFRGLLKAEKLLTRDARKVERKKPGFRKARKKEQYSKR